MNGSRPVQHIFQSFWHGGALPPYEQLCLKSFVDCGHAVDLYTYDVNLAVPSGVRICDATALANQNEVFVYADGFGVGSPAAFSDLFRYMLLVEKGGWWIDTDVVCLTDRIPFVEEFFAYEEADVINGATMYFKPRHPVMIQCLDQARKLGCSIKWGDIGPYLLTRVLEEHGLTDRAYPASICYPIHYSQALDVLRPSKAAVLAGQIEGALFLHLWNAILVHHGIPKSWRPPEGSLLRQLVDKHPINGWAGEYDERTLDYILNLKGELNARAESRASDYLIE
jgi:Alpha 1,4-glycosyltransferase conserved region/Glycosyltransferase sugar-binding region containing DXD motif